MAQPPQFPEDSYERAPDPLDCVVVGGGPAGLTAAIYLARFNLAVAVIDAGDSRAAKIPLTRNHAGFPEGISGIDLLERMRAQAAKFGARLIKGMVTSVKRDGEDFRVTVGADQIDVRSVLLATGVINNRPDMPEDAHDQAVALGLLRYCPICDGYEVNDRKIAVLGSGERGAREALFLRSYSSTITLLASDDQQMPSDLEAALEYAGIARVAGPVGNITIGETEVQVAMPQGTLRFDTLYPALGSAVRSELARDLGAAASSEGCMLVDSHQRTSVAGLYAAGDVVLGLDQISHAMGEGGVAATTIRNDLAARAPLLR